MSHKAFEPAVQSGGLGRTGIRASANVLGFSLFRTVVQFASLVVLSRLLLPADYGLMGMVATATGFASLFRDMGLGVATIQKPDLEHSDINDAFWVNVLASTVLVISLFLLSPIVCSFYGDTRILRALPIVSLSFIASGWSVQHSAILRRQMRFFQIGLIDTIAVLASLLASLALAVVGAGYWALVAGPLVLEGVTCAMLWMLCGWRPTRPRRPSTGSRLAYVGTNMLGINFISYFSSNLDRVLIGRLLGECSLGLYTRATSIVALPTLQLLAPISSVMLPMFSRMRDNPDQYKKTVLSSMRLMVSLSAPAVAILVVCSDWIVTVLLGPKWLGAVPILPALALTYATLFIPNNLGLVLIVANRFRTPLIWNLVNLGGVALGVGLGIRYGLNGVAIVYAAIATFMRVPVFFWMVGKASPISAQSLWAVCLPFWVLAGFSGTLMFLLKRPLATFSPPAGLAMLTFVGGGAYIAMLALTSAGRDLYFDLRRIVAELIPTKKQVPPIEKFPVHR